MLYYIRVGKYKLAFSDGLFAPTRKKPTISIYDAENNSFTKIASFNSKETFEWFTNIMLEQKGEINELVE